MIRSIRFSAFQFAAAVVALSVTAAPALAQEASESPAMVIDVPQATSADDLLEKVRAGFEVERTEDKQREERFKNAREDQRQMLADAKAREAREEARSQALEKEYQEKEVKIAELEEALDQRMGNLGELFGVTRQIAGDTRGLVEASLQQRDLLGLQLAHLDQHATNGLVGMPILLIKHFYGKLMLFVLLFL